MKNDFCIFVIGFRKSQAAGVRKKPTDQGQKGTWSSESKRKKLKRRASDHKSIHQCDKSD